MLGIGSIVMYVASTVYVTARHGGVGGGAAGVVVLLGRVATYTNATDGDGVGGAGGGGGSGGGGLLASARSVAAAAATSITGSIVRGTDAPGPTDPTSPTVAECRVRCQLVQHTYDVPKGTKRPAGGKLECVPPCGVTNQYVVRIRRMNCTTCPITVVGAAAATAAASGMQAERSPSDEAWARGWDKGMLPLPPMIPSVTFTNVLE